MKVYETLKERFQPVMDDEIKDYKALQKQIKNLHTQAQNYNDEADRLEGELKTLDGGLLHRLMIGKPVAKAQEKIETVTKEIASSRAWAKKLTDELIPAAEMGLTKLKRTADSAMGLIVRELSEEISKEACDKFLDFIGVYNDWIDSLNIISGEIKTHFRPTNEHRLFLADAVKNLTLTHRRHWHDINRNIISDFRLCGSRAGDL